MCVDLVVCMDCKVQIDDNARFRHAELFQKRDKTSESAQDIRAEQVGINYIKLDGEIGCLGLFLFLISYFVIN